MANKLKSIEVEHVFAEYPDHPLFFGVASGDVVLGNTGVPLWYPMDTSEDYHEIVVIDPNDVPGMEVVY